MGVRGGLTRGPGAEPRVLGTRTFQVRPRTCSMTRPDAAGRRRCALVARGEDEMGARRRGAYASASHSFLAEGLDGAAHRGRRANRARLLYLDPGHPKRPHEPGCHQHQAALDLDRQRHRRLPPEPARRHRPGREAARHRPVCTEFRRPGCPRRSSDRARRRRGPFTRIRIRRGRRPEGHDHRRLDPDR